MITVSGFVDDAGQFALDDKAKFRALVQKFRGYEVVVTVKKRPKNTTWAQYKYLMGVVIPDIASACGYIPEDEDDCKAVYNGLMFRLFRLPDGPFGEPRRESASRDECDRARLAHIIDTIILHAETTIVGCTIRRPEDVDLDRVVEREWAEAS